LVFERDFTGKQECIGYVDSDYAGDLDKRWSTMGYVFTLSTGKLALYSTVYRCIVYHRGRVYGHDGGYEGGNIASRVTR